MKNTDTREIVATGGGVGAQGDVVDGKAQYESMCATCHGANGEGAALDPSPLAPASECTLVDCTDLAALTDYHDATMPFTDPSACVGDCALNTAAFVISLSDASASGGSGGDLAQGKADYDAMCATCHGANGEGAALDPSPLFPASECTLVDCADLDALVAYHDATMPFTDPSACVGDCALNTAVYVMSFSASAEPAGPVGKAEYDAMCATCHGANGEGAALDPSPLFPASACTLVDCSDQAALTAYHEATMPFTDPTMCVGDCAANTAMYVMSFSAGADDVGDPNAARFASDCSSCHGAVGEGTADFFPQAIGPGGCLIVADCADITELTAYIEANMPSGAADTCVGECAMQTAMFVSTLNPAAAPPPTPPDDPQAALIAQGRMFYDLQCSLCHGPNGEGVIGAHETPLNSVACTLVDSVEGCNDAAAVEAFVIANMPEPTVTDCVAECAQATAALIVSFGAVPLAEVPAPVPAEDPAAVADDPAAVADDPAAVADDPAAVADDPAAVADDPAAVADDPAAVADDPAAVAEDPAAVADDLAAVADDPAAAEELVAPDQAAGEGAAGTVLAGAPAPVDAENGGVLDAVGGVGALPPDLPVDVDAIVDDAQDFVDDVVDDAQDFVDDLVDAVMDAPVGLSQGRTVSMSAAWSNQCAGCHELYGENADVGKTKCDQIYCGRLDRVVHYVDRYMPLGNPDLCRGECAKAMAVLIQQDGNVRAASMLHEVWGVAFFCFL
ncbi:MAG: c-type cytochrome [Gammaproteobacteria bacterium]